MKFPYEDIISLSRPISRHPRMSMTDRAAQFSPFAALTGYDAAIAETGRVTDERIHLDESEKAVLDQKMQHLEKNLSTQPEIKVTYYIPDERKSGGRYVTATGRLKKIDLYERVLLLNEQWIPMDDIVDIDCE